MPDLAGEFRRHADEALKLAEAGEVARLESVRGSRTRQLLHPVRVEALYELAYLRVFVGWEAFLEQAFLRYMCGYTSTRAAPPTLVAGGVFHPNIAAAEGAVLGTNSYVLWHNPTRVVARSRRFFAACVVESIVLSNSARLEAFAAVRHRITHAQADAQLKFDQATMMLNGRRYRGSRPGAFLRDVDLSASAPTRWIERLADELHSLSMQIA